MPVLLAQLLRFAIIAVIQSGLILGAEAILNPLIEKLKAGIKTTFGLSDDDALTYIANFILDTAELAGLTVISLKTRMPLKVADKLGFTARGFTRGALPVKVSTGANAPGAAAKAAASAGPVTKDTIASGIAATKGLSFAGVQGVLLTIAAVVGSTTFTLSTIGNWIDFGNWNSGAYQGTFNKIFAVFGLVPDAPLPKSSTVSDDVWTRVYNTYRELGAYAINDPYKLQSVIFSKQALIDLVDKIGASLNAETGSAPAKAVLAATHALVLTAANGGTGGTTTTSGGGGGGTTTTSAAVIASSGARVLTGIVSQGVLSEGLSFTARPDDLIESTTELQVAAQNNLASWLTALPGKIVYEVKIVSSVITKDGFKQSGTTQQIPNGTFANGTQKYKTVTNKFAVLIIYAITDKGTRTKLTQITLGPTNSGKLIVSAGDLNNLAVSLPDLVATTKLADISNVTQGGASASTTAPASAAASNTPAPAPVINPVNSSTGSALYNISTPSGSYSVTATSYTDAIAQVNAIQAKANAAAAAAASGGGGSSSSPAKPGANASSLAEWYAAQGLPLASVSQRALAYQGFGLGQASYYTGTAEQNSKLLTALKSH